MITPDNPYYRQVQLLVRVLPAVAAEGCFALKGGTAINLFVRDLPRLSVDIDLAFLPITEFDVARRQISEALGRIRDRLLGASPAYKVTAGTNDRSGHFDTLNVSDAAAQIKIEVNPVLRGSLDEPVVMTVRAAVEETFGFAEVKTLSFADLYGGKLMAAIDRQHPRDLFDVKLLLDNEGMSDALFRSFFVYLIGHKGSLADSLDPNKKNIRKIYEDHFKGMTAEPVSIEELEQTRERLIDEIRGRLGEREKQFLLLMKRGEPDWDLLALGRARELPAVKWKLHNLRRMPAIDRERAIERLLLVLERI